MFESVSFKNEGFKQGLLLLESEYFKLTVHLSTIFGSRAQFEAWRQPVARHAKAFGLLNTVHHV